MTAVKGVANFDSLSLNKAGTYKLTISDGGLTINTVKFTVSAAAAAELAFAGNPATQTAGQTFSQAVSVTDSFGNPVSGVKVKLAIVSGPTGATVNGTVGGTLKVVAENGVATFSDIDLTLGGGYTLKATHGSLSAATSTPFTVIHAAAAKLAFGQQPTGAAVGAAISPAIAVDVEDAFGNIITSDSSEVSLVLNPPSRDRPRSWVAR